MLETFDSNAFEKVTNLFNADKIEKPIVVQDEDDNDVSFEFSSEMLESFDVSNVPKPPLVDEEDDEEDDEDSAILDSVSKDNEDLFLESFNSFYDDVKSNVENLKEFRNYSGDADYIEVNLSSETIAGLKHIGRLNTRFFDVISYGSVTVFCVQAQNGTIVAHCVSNIAATKGMQFQLPTQIISIIKSTYVRLIIKRVGKGKLLCSFYKLHEDNPELNIEFVEGVPDLGYIEPVMYTLTQGRDFGTSQEFVNLIPTIKKFCNRVRGLSNSGIVIQNGIIYIDCQNLKVFCPTKQDRVSLIIPSFVLNWINSEKRPTVLRGARFEFNSGMSVLRMGKTIVCWRIQNIISTQEYDLIQQAESLAYTGLQLGSIKSFLSSLKLSKNMEQSCSFNLLRKEFVMYEGDLVAEASPCKYIVPLKLVGFERTGKQSLSQSSSPFSEKGYVNMDDVSFKLDLKTVSDVINNLSNNAMLEIFDRFVRLSSIDKDEQGNMLNVQFVISYNM